MPQQEFDASLFKKLAEGTTAMGNPERIEPNYGVIEDSRPAPKAWLWLPANNIWYDSSFGRQRKDSLFPDPFDQRYALRYEAYIDRTATHELEYCVSHLSDPLVPTYGYSDVRGFIWRWTADVADCSPVTTSSTLEGGWAPDENKPPLHCFNSLSHLHSHPPIILPAELRQKREPLGILHFSAENAPKEATGVDVGEDSPQALGCLEMFSEPVVDHAPGDEGHRPSVDADLVNTALEQELELPMAQLVDLGMEALTSPQSA
jgi:hypothetical protein